MAIASPKFPSAHRCDRAIGDRNLPWANHLVTHRHRTNGTITDRNQERFVSHRRQTNAFCNLEFNARQINCRQIAFLCSTLTMHFGGLPSKNIHRHINRRIIIERINHFQLTLFGQKPTTANKQRSRSQKYWNNGKLSGAILQTLTLLRFITQISFGAMPLSSSGTLRKIENRPRFASFDFREGI